MLPEPRDRKKIQLEMSCQRTREETKMGIDSNISSHFNNQSCTKWFHYQLRYNLTNDDRIIPHHHHDRYFDIGMTIT